MDDGNRNPNATTARHRPVQDSVSLPLYLQVFLLTRRSLSIVFRQAGGFLPGFLLGVFFLVIYEGSLGGAAALFLEGQDYLGFILPLSVISTALSGAGIAGEVILRDIRSGYFSKLLLTPVSRSALLLAPMITTAIIITIQTSGVIGVALLLGLQPVTGLPGLVVLLGYALLVSLALAGLVVGIALMTNSSSATTSATFLVFPFTFLTSTFTPLELLQGWIRVAAELNPVTYILTSTRSLINEGWNLPALAQGVGAALAVMAVTFTFAFWALRRQTRQR